MSDRRAKKACTECRQQKAKCNAHNFEDTICSRCRKMKLTCVMSDSFEREHKRRKLSEIERENIQLRRRLESSQAMSASSTSTSEARPQSQTALKDLEQPKVDSSGYVGNSTLPRQVDGITVEAEAINNLFDIFFRDFSQYLPILDPGISPNSYYASSPLLFWTVIAIACRRQARFRISPGDLKSPVINLAVSSLSSDANVISVQALLILLKWPFPKTHRQSEFQSQLNGAMLHMAMQIGLHIPISSHEYSRVKLQLTPAEIDKRAELWGYCVLIYQRVCLAKGLPGTTLQDLTLDPDQRKVLLDTLPADLTIQLQVQGIVARCGNEAAKIGLRTMSEDRERALDIVLRVHERQIDEVIASSKADVQLNSLIARITIQAMHFLKNPSSLAEDQLLISNLASNTCEWVETVSGELESGRMNPAAVSVYYMYSVLVACCVLLRLLKVPIFCNKLVNTQRATAAFYNTVKFLKETSLETNDIYSRAMTMMQQLFQSKRAFLRPDTKSGEREAAPLRVRSRVAICHLLDAWAWWREEFGGQAGTCPPPLLEAENSNGVNGDGTTTSAQPLPTVPASSSAPTQDTYSTGPMPNANIYDMNGFSEAQLDTNFDNLIGDDIFSDLWSFWPDVYNWPSTGLS